MSHALRSIADKRPVISRASPKSFQGHKLMHSYSLQCLRRMQLSPSLHHCLCLWSRLWRQPDKYGKRRHLGLTLLSARSCCETVNWYILNNCILNWPVWSRKRVLLVRAHILPELLSRDWLLMFFTGSSVLLGNIIVAIPTPNVRVILIVYIHAAYPIYRLLAPS